MKLQFEKNQQFQLDAISSMVNLFEGQPLNKSDFEISFTDSNTGSLRISEKGVGNQLQISEERLLANLQKIQKTNELREDEYSAAMAKMSYTDAAQGKTLLDFPNFSLEMETGTGKTYVYLRSIYELNKVYGFKKFVIVVPSIAIREGVLKSLEITHEHFQELYNNTPCEYKVYDSTKLNHLSQFAKSNAIQILILNIDSFAKDQNVINQKRESGIRPIELIQLVNPIVFMDEPQNMETDIRKKAIANLNPLMTFRFSATHRDLYNLIYKLDPVRAYDLGLVKQIEVDSVFSKNDTGGAFLSLDAFKLNKKFTSAKLTIHCNEKNGVVKKQVTAKNGDNLFDLSKGVEVYRNGYIINFIDSEEGFIEFSGGTKISQGESQGGLTDHILKDMIRATVENHFRKEKLLLQLGIKVLSLVFIDHVANYRSYVADATHEQGKYAKWFEEIYNEISHSPQYASQKNFPVEKVHNGYFSQDKGKFKDSREGKLSKADDDTFQLIMKDKERLLDINEPLRFIFSHSALREGWDNPNVFQICTLNESHSELKKRQELGRGLRLCVDSTGKRIFDRSTNRLTVIANEAYEDFAKSLQTEIENDCGVKFEGRIKDARKKETIRLKKNWNLDPHFIDLWGRIKFHTEYQVEFDTAELIKRVVHNLKQMATIPKPQIQRIKTETTYLRDKNNLLIKVDGIIKSSKEKTITDVKYEIPDFMYYIQSKTELTRDTIGKILLQSGKLGEMFNNPQLFMEKVVQIINEECIRLKVDGIKYEKIAGQFYKMTLFESREIEEYISNIVPVVKQEKTLYNYIPIDSLSTPELNFAKACDERDDVLFYIKLPAWFQIKTPLGMYNPDWALIKKEDGDEKKIYFVAETKDAKAVKDRNLLRPSERMKITCGEKHFKKFENVEFKVVSSVTELS